MLQWAIDPSDHGARKDSLSTRDFPIQEIDVPRPGARRCVGVLAMPRARGRLARPEHEHGRIVHRDSRGKGGRRSDQIAFSGTRRADPGRCRREACKIRCWIGIEIHGPERAGPAETGHTTDQTPQDQSFERKIVIQSSGVMISTASFERRTGTNSKSTRSRQWSAHSSNKRSSPHSIN